MIDIIIPVFNAHKSLVKTLASIAIQTIVDKVKVYIIDDCSDHNYDNEIAIFKGTLDITQIKTDKNRGAGFSRELGIKNSKGEYLLFLDSNDLLYESKSLEKLYNPILFNKYDAVIGSYIREGALRRDDCVFSSDKALNCLRGKIYSRKYIVDNNIHFNYSRYSEDNSFNGIVCCTSSNLKFIDDIVYVYKYSFYPIQTNNPKNLINDIGYLHNMLWLAREIEKRTGDFGQVSYILLDSLCFIFNHYCYGGYNFDDLFVQCFLIEVYCKKYNNYYNKDVIINALKRHFAAESDFEELYIRFLGFRDQFKKVGDLNDRFNNTSL